jgi:hypothetical protein
MLVLGVIFLFPETPTVTAGDMNYTVVVLGGVLALSLVWYYFPKYGGVHWFTGPVRTIDIPESAGSTDTLEDEKDKKGESEAAVTSVPVL